MKTDKSRILLIDIETFPMLVEVWQPWEANALRTLRETTLASIAWKWLGERYTKCKTLKDYGYKFEFPVIDDSKIVKEAWRLIDEADVVVGHNAKSFDVKKLYARFLTHGLPPPSPFVTVDTLLEARKVAAFDSNKLNDLGRQVGFGEKEETGGFPLWVRCQENDPIAWRKMKIYNKRDVVLLEKIYLYLRPFMKTHPNQGLFVEGSVCPKCGSGHLQSRGVARTTAALYKRYHCQSCGGWSRGKVKTAGTQITNL